MIAAIHEYKGRQELYLRQKPATLNRLVEIAKVQSTESSNKIEGIVTTATRVRQLCEQKVTPRNRDEEEISGYRDALALIHESYEYIPIKTSYILQLHRVLYGYSQRGIGGRFKSVQNYIEETRADGARVIGSTPLDPFETPGAMEAICESYNREIDACEVDPLILIAAFVLDFLCIHPFNDGNGRMSRLLTALLLYRAGYVVGRFVSLESKIERTKDGYYEALLGSDVDWRGEENDITPFVKYLLGIVLAAYRDFEDRVALLDRSDGRRASSALDLVKAAVANTLGKFTKNDILQRVPSLGKSSVEYALKTLVDNGFIVRSGNGKATFYYRRS